MLNWMNRLSLRGRLRVLFVAAVFGWVVISGVGAWGLMRIQQTFDTYSQHDVKALAHLGHLQGSANALRRNEKDMLINLGNSKKANESVEDWEQARAKAQAALEGLNQLDLGDTVRNSSQAMLKHLQTYKEGFAGVAKTALAGGFETAADGNKAIRPFKTSVDAIEEGVVALEQLIQERRELALANKDKLVKRVGATLLGATMLLLLVFLFLSQAVRRSIVEPLDQAREAAERIASRDLTGQILLTGEHESGRLLKAMSIMQSSIGGVVSDVKLNAETIATAAREVADGAQDLSSRTERAAAELQAAASAMDELTQSVEQNSASAHEARRKAESARDVARVGGEQVTQVVQTMAIINQSSQRVSDIIGTIDGIAFQTNILALNAAVEAARAGEQGRGFAVVASEVRALAGRSAAAAKEIKNLIQQSGEEVHRGVELVERSGRTMSEIVQAIEQVSALVSNISHATDEQREGISQVGEVVTRLDEMTQQNAALVEESAAAASSLQVQADGLTHVVRGFQMA